MVASEVQVCDDGGMTDHTTPHADRCESCASTAPARRYRYTYEQASALLCSDCFDFAHTSKLVECDATGEEL